MTVKGQREAALPPHPHIRAFVQRFGCHRAVKQRHLDNISFQICFGAFNFRCSKQVVASRHDHDHQQAPRDRRVGLTSVRDDVT